MRTPIDQATTHSGGVPAETLVREARLSRNCPTRSQTHSRRRSPDAPRSGPLDNAAKAPLPAEQNMTMLDVMIEVGGMTDFAGHGQSPSAFAASLQAGATAGGEVVGSVEGARPNAARASTGCEGGAVGSCTSLAADATGKWPSGCGGREGLSAEGVLGIRRVGGPGRVGSARRCDDARSPCRCSESGRVSRTRPVVGEPAEGHRQETCRRRAATQ